MKKKRSIADRVKEIIAVQACVEEKEVMSGANLVDDLGMDLLDLVEMAMNLEEEFDYDEIRDEDAEKWRTVEDVIGYVEERSATKKGSGK